MLNVIAFVKKVVGGAVQAALHGHTPATATAAAAKVEQAFVKAYEQRETVFDAIEAAKSARVATLAAIHADIAAFEAIKKLLP